MSIKPYTQQLPPTESNPNPVLQTAALSTNEATYKLKKSDTTNTFHLVNMASGDIFKQTSVIIELDKV